MARLEAAIMVRVDDMDATATAGSRAIRIPLTSTDPRDVDAAVIEALSGVPRALGCDGKLVGWERT